MEVIQAIRRLLFLEDCVIIPGLGGFLSQYRPAVIDKATGTFIPPAKVVVFNSELVQNDGLLVNFIAGKSGISTDKARLEVDRFVEETREKLEHNYPVDIEGIGQFIRDKSQRIRFQADPGTNLYLGSFGLASFHLHELAPLSHLTDVNSWIPKQEDSSRTIEFDIPEFRRGHGGRTLRRIAIAMPLLIAFCLLPFNSRITDTLSPSTASMIPEPSLFRLNYPDAMTRDTAKLITFPIEEVSSEKVEAVVGRFPVIAGCFKIKENAKRLHKQLIEKGYPATITPSRNGLLYKVSMESFASRQEAVAGLARLKKAEPGMELWVAM